ncbi:nudix hydrolase 15, mitochondrial-like isoform X2 [Lycium ferocissimum]|uniref:nudix hydrolase 15, mitochondrial-like isoform X2 n=1 Tax=Lycium ferocissimum TaxID=112874 RepID=UPI002815108F|nr:nudix hydrolase 15, mitochondrial-like isoform X2 [Lycium ferocissimum]
MACIAPSELMNCKADQKLTKKLQPIINFSSTEDEEITEYTDNLHENSYIVGIKEYITNRNLHLSKVISREKRAAVLICLFEGLEGELRVILTKRSMKLSTHPGEVALPGGKMDDEDLDDSATALREAKEEIGLKSSLVQVITNLEPFISLEENHRRVEKEYGIWKYVCHIFEYESSKPEIFRIAGLTASILIHAASIIYQEPPSFSEYLPDFSQLQFTLNTKDSC